MPKQGRYRLLRPDLTRYVDTYHSRLAASMIFQMGLCKVGAELPFLTAMKF